MDLFFNIYFGIDIFVNLISAYNDETNKTIYSYKKVLINYLTGWFIIDFISIFPTEYLEIKNTNYNKLFRLLRIPRLYKLTNIIKLSKSTSTNPFIIFLIEMFKINQGVKNFMNIIALMLSMSHISACFFYFTSRMNDNYVETWVYRLGL